MTEIERTRENEQADPEHEQIDPEDEQIDIAPEPRPLPQVTIPSPEGETEETRPSTPRTDVKYKGTGFAWSWLGWLIIVIAILPVIVQNTQIVQVRYLIWDIRIPLAAAFLAVAVIAQVATEIIGWTWRARRRRELTMKAELQELRRQTAPDA